MWRVGTYMAKGIVTTIRISRGQDIDVAENRVLNYL